MPGVDVPGVFGGNVRGRAPPRRNDGSPRGTAARAGKAAGVRKRGGEAPQSPPPTTKTAAANEDDLEGNRPKTGQLSTPPLLQRVLYPPPPFEEGWMYCLGDRLIGDTQRGIRRFISPRR